MKIEKNIIRNIFIKKEIKVLKVLIKSKITGIIKIQIILTIGTIKDMIILKKGEKITKKIVMKSEKIQINIISPQNKINKNLDLTAR